MRHKISKTTKKHIRVLKRMIKVHYNSTKPMDDYYTGMYNGMVFALTLLDNKEPKYKRIYDKTRRKL